MPELSDEAGDSKLSAAHYPVPWVGPDHRQIIEDARRISADVSTAADILAEGQKLRFPGSIRGARRVALDVARNAKGALDALIIELGG